MIKNINFKCDNNDKIQIQVGKIVYKSMAEALLEAYIKKVSNEDVETFNQGDSMDE